MWIHLPADPVELLHVLTVELSKVDFRVKSLAPMGPASERKQVGFDIGEVLLGICSKITYQLQHARVRVADGGRQIRLAVSNEAAVQYEILWEDPRASVSAGPGGLTACLRFRVLTYARRHKVPCVTEVAKVVADIEAIGYVPQFPRKILLIVKSVVCRCNHRLIFL